MADYLAIAVGNLINLYNPEQVILGGPIGQASKLLVDMVQQKVHLNALAYPLSAVKITRSSLGKDAEAVGASVLVLQRANELILSNT
jgi:glucokinase